MHNFIGFLGFVVFVICSIASITNVMGITSAPWGMWWWFIGLLAADAAFVVLKVIAAWLDKRTYF